MKRMYAFLALCILSLIFSPISYASGINAGLRSGVQIQSLISYPTNASFVEEVSMHDTKYRPNQVITFRIIVTNYSDSVSKDVTVIDKLPTYKGQRIFDYMTSGGIYQPIRRTITFPLHELQPNQSITLDIQAKVLHASLLPHEQLLTLMPGNVATVFTPGHAYTDQSSFIISTLDP